LSSVLIDNNVDAYITQGSVVFYLMFGFSFTTLLVIPIILVFIIFDIGARINKQPYREIIFTKPYVLVLPIILTFIFSVIISFYSPIFKGRYLLIALPAAYLFIADIFMDNRSHIIKQNPGIAKVFTLVIAIIMIFNLPGFYKPWKQQWRQSAEYILSIDSCMNTTIPVWSKEPWGDYKQLYKYYINKISNIRLLAIGPEHKSSSKLTEARQKCPVKLWVAHLADRSLNDHIAMTMKIMNLSTRNTRIRKFGNEAYILEEI